MPEQLRPESKDLGEAATTTLNPEPRTPNLKNLVKQNPLTRAFFSCIIASVVVMNYVY